MADGVSIDQACMRSDQHVTSIFNVTTGTPNMPIPCLLYFHMKSVKPNIYLEQID